MIYTFYSFKGGVGRSMALANVAECFRERGLRTLMIDWDLEAPGLENYFYPAKSKELDAIQGHDGLIDLLQLYKSRHGTMKAKAAAALIPALVANSEPDEQQTSRLPSFLQAAAAPVTYADESSLPFPERLDAELQLDSYICDLQAAAGGRLAVMPAGNRRNPGFGKYVTQIQGFDWTGFYALHDGSEFFEWLRSRLDKLFDVILIDSRTGVTEMGGVCTRQLADVVVSFCAPNAQNIDGTMRIGESLQPQNLDPARTQGALQLLVIPSRIDDSESDRLGEFQTRFRESFQVPELVPIVLNKQEDPFWSLKIPYIPLFNYMERRVIGPGAPEVKSPTDKLVDSYRHIAAALAALAAPTHAIREKFAGEIPRYFPALGPQLLLSWEGPAGAAMAAALRTDLSHAQIPLWPDLDHHDTSLVWQAAIDRALTLVVLLPAASPDSEALRREVRYARQLGKQVYVLTDVTPSLSSMPLWTTGLPVRKVTRAQLNDLGSSQPTRRVPYMAPVLPAETIRREAVDQVKQLIMQENPCAVLCGPAGAGCRTLAAQLCDDPAVGAAFPDGILWLDIGDSPNLAEKWRELFVALYGDVSVPSAPEVIRRQVSAQLNSASLLLVLNHVRSPRQLAELPFTGKRLRTLITSNVSGWHSVGPAVELGPLLPGEADELLRLFAPIGQDLAKEIAGEAGYMPLTVAAAGAAFHFLPAGDPDSVWRQVLNLLRNDGITGLDSLSPRIAVGAVLQSRLDRLDSLNRVRLVQLTELSADGCTLKELMDHLRLSESSAASFLDEIRALFLVTVRVDSAATKQERTQEQEQQQTRIMLDPLIRRYLRRPTAAQSSGSRRIVMSAVDARDNLEVKLAQTILEDREAISPSDALKLARKLKNQRYFEMARLLLAKISLYPATVSDPDLALVVAQQQALCTYKDTELPMYQRLRGALDILEKRAALKDTKNQETLGIAGAIHKELWKYDGQRRSLELSLAFYARGANGGVRGDRGYTALNTAFIQDLLASQESGDENAAALRRDEAAGYRQQIAAELPRMMNEPGGEKLREDWWTLVTLGEALYGLRRYDDALSWLKLALQYRGADWEYEATARQLATLANLVDDSDAPREDKDAARETLRFFLGNDAAIAASLRLGKVGLALSGGGFRASLFHIGVLARLAELDLLRNVEVLSCVSGGSIVGAHYYLEVRNLLQSKPDWQITRQDYLDLVARVARDFTDGVQCNLRTRLALNPFVSLRSAFKPNYTRTDRLGELYEKHIFSRTFPPGEAPDKLWLDAEQLTVHPPDEPQDFSPKLDNWRRSAKVPNLILNATTLNTGHSWQFGVTWMGEPPYNISSEADATERLRRMYYWEAPKRYQRVRLGHAVAASSCVPLLFEPLALPGLYRGRTVQLVDGGVHDNQGAASLLEQDCTVLLVSDASGQMPTQLMPSAEALGVPMRVNSIQQARLRESELVDLNSRRRSSLLRGLLLLHLKADTDSPPVDWIRENAAEQGPKAATKPPRETVYGIDRKAQEALAALRTDLDTFNDQEAGALMLSGYRMASYYITQALPGLPPSPGAPDWWFLQMKTRIDPAPSDVPGQNETMRILKAGHKRFFRMMSIAPSLGVLTIALIVLLAGSWLLWLANADSTFLDVGILILPILLLVVVLALVALILRWRRVKSLTQFAMGLLFIPASLIAAVQMLVFDPLYLYAGGIARPDTRRHSRTGVAARLILFIVGMLLLAAGPWIPGAWSNVRAQQLQTTAAQLSTTNASAALPVWNDLLKLRPDDPTALRNRALAEATTSNWTQAIQDYTSLDRVSGLTLDDYKHRAYARLQAGDLQGSADDYKRVIAATPDDSDAIRQRDALLQKLPQKPGLSSRVPPSLSIPPPPVATDQPRVFIQVATEQQKKDFSAFAALLRANGYSVPAIEVVGSRDPSTTQVRLSTKDPLENSKAVMLIDQLRRMGLAAQGPFVISTGTPRPNIFELWIAAGTPAPAPPRNPA